MTERTRSPKQPDRLVICSKSRWLPAIRREHALTQEAVRRGMRTDFLEAPLDVRSAKSRPLTWLRGLLQTYTPSQCPDFVSARSTIVPGHRGGVADFLETSLLDRLLSPATDDSAVVAYLPWQWRSVAASNAGRKVFDCTDDWTRLYPAAAKRIRQQLTHIAKQADEIIVVAPALQALFPGRKVHVVPNATPSSALAEAPTLRPNANRMVYVGTLSERFDVELVRAVAQRYAEWTIDLYGPCAYAGHGSMPAPELRTLLDQFDGQVTWRGVAARSELTEIIDSADVMLLPNRPEISAGQSSMKLYDYSARGRAIVSTPMELPEGQVPPGSYFAATADEFVASVGRAIEEKSSALVAQRVEWARQNTWESRWPVWSRLVFGSAAVEAVL